MSRRDNGIVASGGGRRSDRNPWKRNPTKPKPAKRSTEYDAHNIYSE